MSDDQRQGFEDDLRSRFHVVITPEMPSTIPATARRLATDQSASKPYRRPGLGAFAMLVVAALVVGLFARIPVFGQPSIGPSGVSTHALGAASANVSASPSATATAPENPGTNEPWTKPWIPVALAALDQTHLVLVGSTGDGIGDAVVAASDDGGHQWMAARLGQPALDGVAAVGQMRWATSTCAPDASTDCLGGLIISPDAGRSWRLSAAKGLSDPAFVDVDHGWAFGAATPSSPLTLQMTTDGGETWAPTARSCPATVSQGVDVEFTSPVNGWLACAGDSGSARKRRRSLGRTTAAGSGNPFPAAGHGR